MLIAVLNNSTMVSNADVNTMCEAIQIQLDLHFLPAWHLQPATIKFYADATKVPNYAWTLFMIDEDSQVPDALGYHQETSDKVNGFIMCQPILSNGGTVLAFDKNNPGNYTVSGTLSHEVLETVSDRFTNLYADNEGISWCLEMCDTCEQVGYGIMVGNINVAVSDFCFPSFFNPQATSANAPFNYLKSFTGPFQILPGGYAIQRAGGPGTETQVFGEAMPQWRRECKMKAFSRAGRKLMSNK